MLGRGCQVVAHVGQSTPCLRFLNVVTSGKTSKGAFRQLRPLRRYLSPGLRNLETLSRAKPFSVFSGSNDHVIHFEGIFSALSLTSPVTCVSFVGADFEDLFDDDDVQ